MVSFIVILTAYYIVGVIIFVRDVMSLDDDDPALKILNQTLDKESDRSVLWTAVKLATFIVFVHIPMWIIRL
ncbi:hypothetical protein pEaSNUABM40_00304 [Erwinia phage pEa_SNUABM_40]|uniref:Uncharacterized protein n=1 Tax=Erwinia phage pEa_SNUABM_3 TaxID=2869552 RepID=A0AAE8BYP2_9CAUD|nr:hypothetical protein MPK68_gp302 [Erwinia phage pEa_SNUABM_3]QZE56836.1 hypothetical protein pEaSNUABM20_00300 [Erwinia phage pEa_SNUABM_20]QZE58520.1 hypothetical protein pEaSNUABM40_00304 [Erwinia phage pEa_SNUABM_40]UAW53081.1 hypothetical protein pEaSNUABM23_00299 [Erwinia phage pEa_SNUABM_23]UIW10976.1 hypothetical protein pEaSNUABM23_00299 [Erwinia phage pEa_SNUABM_31]QZE56499.1 hypothetical protein pEaSNUABM3_00302 [Erwinia phage pEa_SNUABM_3]